MNVLSESIRVHQYPCNLSCPPLPAAASQLLKGLSTVYRAAAPFKGFHTLGLKRPFFPLFMSATSPYFGDPSGGGSTKVSLKSKEDGNEFSNCRRGNYSNYSRCLVLILCGIFRAGSGVHRGPVRICTSVYMWEHVRQVP